jgi:hypothetical protein
MARGGLYQNKLGATFHSRPCRIGFALAAIFRVCCPAFKPAVIQRIFEVSNALRNADHEVVVISLETSATCRVQ